MKHWIRNLLILSIALGALSAVGAWYSRRNAGDGSALRTAPVTRGDLVATIGATGTLQPEEVINVGAQVAGRITEFGKDASGKPIDYKSEVEAGTILALIDPAVYQSDVDSAEAQLGSAKAGVDRALADLGQFKARFNQAQRDWDRAQKLGPSDALAQVEYDTYQSSYEATKANVAVGEASVEQAKRAVAQAQASVDRARRNLAFCTITSPVKGVIIDRRVNIGQTVVASLNAPSLFLLAKDLRRLQVWVAVNEADIGSIHPGQRVTFTVDARPGRTFVGEVRKVRLNASMTQNVVTYTVEVTADNSDGTLIPYLTANAHFEVNRREDVMMVPNSALRWTPSEDQVAPDVRKAMASSADPADGPSRGERRAEGGGAGSGSREGRRAGRGPTTRDTMAAIANAPADEWRDGMIWVRDGEFLRPIRVRAGASDGTSTEIAGDDVKEGLEVIVGTHVAGSGGGGSAAGTNPFQPRFPGGGRGRGPRM